MAHYTAEALWERGEHQPFTDRRYSRAHVLRFDGGIEVPASSSPQIVPVPMSLEAAVDPEEAFIAALSSCHMLWFLDIAARAGYCVERYHDQAEGVMSRNAEGKMAMTRVTLRPQVIFGGETRPGAEEIGAMHHRAHEECFIANSVRADVVVEGR